MPDTRYVLTDRAEQVMSVVDRLLVMSQEQRLDLAHNLYCSSQYLMTQEDDIEGVGCLIDALEALAAVNARVEVNVNVN